MCVYVSVCACVHACMHLVSIDNILCFINTCIIIHHRMCTTGYD